MQPIDHTSIYEEYTVGPKSNSGARYHKLTTYWVITVGDIFLARPKSHIFNIP
jgi:hypothetical protein